ncbi:MAG: flavin reductase family protein [Alphaproteobacteria bacterium]|nr:flavin reductase [Rhodobiaceae bacterium]MBO6542405.1 flavin reductase family protein [Alphaproteobacteria bacterium]MBO6628977.1 flavin reductase family protein [Alphaproteobacteria bacterium]MDF1624808.1 flavin reductase family protein [Parvibaculaceae bacterium]|tara:strand:- start:1625 stop:2104 length:480 start_codon:yes stop_codon:yes gene_type:complete
MTDQKRAFRNALGEFATGVAVVTTAVDGEAPIGLTINSFSSVSLEPPLVLWCLDKGSDTFDLFGRAKGFTINILNAEQQAVSGQLARPGHHGLGGLALEEGSNHCPRLVGAPAAFECEVEARHDAGDHVIFVGRVVAFHRDETHAPLIYHRGHYRALSA